MACRRVKTDIGKVEIESNEDAILCPSSIKDSEIGVTPQIFIEHRVHIVTGRTQQSLGRTR